MKVKVVKMYPDVKLPWKDPKNPNNYCYDVYAYSDGEPVYDEKTGEVLPNVVRYHTGLKLQLVRDTEIFNVFGETDITKSVFAYDFKTSKLILDIDGRSRSSIYKTGLILCNCTATLDEPYTGEIIFNFYDVVPSLPNYKKGDRIGQIKLGMTLPFEFEIVDSLEKTDRDEKGFGSSDNIKKN